jgi:hypothetical protein
LPSGAGREGDDSAKLLKASWRATRRAVLGSAGISEFAFRQYLFASQARVLLKLQRPHEVRPRHAAQAWQGQADGRRLAQCARWV